jgi:hypothetical protein
MKSTRNLIAGILFATLTLAVTGAHAARTAPMVEQENMPLSAAKALTPAEAKKSIIAAAVRKGWRVVKDNPGNLRFEYLRGKHMAVIDVPYTTKSYGIKYVASDNLNYQDKDGRRLIHPTYNDWVNGLVQAINLEMIKY